MSYYSWKDFIQSGRGCGEVNDCQDTPILRGHGPARAAAFITEPLGRVLGVLFVSVFLIQGVEPAASGTVGEYSATEL